MEGKVHEVRTDCNTVSKSLPFSHVEAGGGDPGQAGFLGSLGSSELTHHEKQELVAQC